MKIEEYQIFSESNEIYKPEQIKYVLSMIEPYIETVQNNKDFLYNIPCSFDIETSSFYRSNGKDTEKCAIMYEWTFGIFGIIVIGRTWSEFVNMMTIISETLELTDTKRLICYVHNLNFEFQFMRKYFNWSKVFAVDQRRPVYGITDIGIEFRCSYILSGYSLGKLAENLQLFEIKKLIGNLDYRLIRHSKTQLSNDELAYCVNDAKIVMDFIFETIEKDGNIAKIPLTKTGYVRIFCRKACFYGLEEKKNAYKYTRYHKMMSHLTIEENEYTQLKRAFAGGFTHANPFCSGKIIENVTSFDFTSSYPAVMLSEKFPMSKGEQVNIKSVEDFERNLKIYCCLFDVKFYGLQSKLYHDSYISISRCIEKTNYVANNGRLVSADYIRTTVTECDFDIIKKFYTWEYMEIGNFIRYKKNYLPTDFVKSILKLYADKTTLKNVDGKEAEYLIAKEMLNSCYGMTVTDIVRYINEYVYDNWQEPQKPDLTEELNKYNTSKSRFLFYPWGVWVTAYARKNLFTGILEFASDYVYSDTDSVKVINADQHIDYINNYNKSILHKLKIAMKYHGIDDSAICPKTIDGIEKPLGVWDFDGHYSRFKTLGAKRYMVEYSNDHQNGKKCGQISLTVSGLNKHECIPYLLDKYGKDKIFDEFKDGLYIPPKFTGKLTHSYIDECRCGEITDYTGQEYSFEELSAVHLNESDYNLSISNDYVTYLKRIKTIEMGV